MALLASPDVGIRGLALLISRVEKLYAVTFIKELPRIVALVNSDSSELLTSHFLLLLKTGKIQKYILRARQSAIAAL